MKLNIPKLIFVLSLCTLFILFATWIVLCEQDKQRRDELEQQEQQETERENWHVSDPPSETSNFNELKLQR